MYMIMMYHHLNNDSMPSVRIHLIFTKTRRTYSRDHTILAKLIVVAKVTVVRHAVQFDPYIQCDVTLTTVVPILTWLCVILDVRWQLEVRGHTAQGVG